MKKKGVLGFRYVISVVLILFLLINLTSCYRQRELEYYSEKDNFISVTAEISHVKYNTDNRILYLAFSNLSDEFSDNHFKIVGENWEIIKQNGGEEAIKIGKEITFITASRYFGDGYMMPIVAISVGEDVLLEFEEGYKNFMKTYK